MQLSLAAIAALLAGSVGTIVLSFFLHKSRRKPHRFLICFLIVLLYFQAYSFSFQTGLMLKSPIFLNTNVPLVFLLGPLLHGYIQQLKNKPISKLQWIIHLIPFMFVTVYYFSFYLQESAYKFNVIVESIGANEALKPYTKSFQSDPWNLIGWIVVELQCLHLLVYGIVTYAKLFKSQIQSTWLVVLNFSLIGASVILFLSEGGVVNGVRFLATLLPEPSNEFFAVVVMYAAAFYLMLNPTVLASYLPKYRKSTINEDWRKRKAEALLTTLEKNKLYLNTNLSLQLVADAMGIKKHHLSQVINQELGCTFFELINRYRIKEARHVLSQEEDCKMEALAYQLGYRSKSAFFIAFKKETSQTPGQFARNI